MKKLIGIILAGLFLISGISVTALAPSQQPTDQTQPTRSFTHTVFAEDATATWCGYCHFAREALDKIYSSGDYPFYYVCLVDDMDTHSHQRTIDYNVWGFPTVYFDGGNIVKVGGSSGSESQYRSAIVTTGARTVSNIDVGLNVTWLGDAAMDIRANVTNHEGSAYSGHIRVYVTEVESSMGWHDTAGHPYTFPLLDYAMNQDISVNSGATWTNELTWDGHNYNDGHGHNFGNIQYGNIEVIAVVFNSQSHTGYSNPPSGNPFTAYWVDDATGVQVGIPVNHPPNKPSSPNPSNGAINIAINKQLGWTCTDPDSDPLNFDVFFGTTNPPPQVSSHQSGKTYNPGAMAYETTYYWKVLARDDQGLTNESSVWSFTTGTKPDTTAPTLTVVKPKDFYLYVFDKEKRQLSSTTFIIGKITLTANATDSESGVKLVSFLIDNQVAANVTSAPFTYLWSAFYFGGVHHITIIAYDNAGNHVTKEIIAHKLL
jgi:glutaredoxin